MAFSTLLMSDEVFYMSNSFACFLLKPIGSPKKKVKAYRLLAIYICNLNKRGNICFSCIGRIFISNLQHIYIYILDHIVFKHVCFTSTE